MSRLLCLVPVAALELPSLAMAEGCLAQEPEKLPDLELGLGETGYGASQEDYMEREGEAEMFFVPIRPGEHAWACRGLEGKGMAGEFIVT